MKILIIAEHDQATLKLATHHTITAAVELGGDIDLLIVGFHCQKAAELYCYLMLKKY